MTDRILDQEDIDCLRYLADSWIPQHKWDGSPRFTMEGIVNGAGGTRSKTAGRVRRLADWGFIDCVQSRPSGVRTTCRIYFLSPKGRQEIENHARPCTQTPFRHTSQDVAEMLRPIQ